jgi:hypothetical protein
MNENQEPMSHDEAERTKAVEGYLLNDLSEEERLNFEAHYFECEVCAAAIFAGQSLLEGIRKPDPWWKKLAFRLRKR